MKPALVLARGLALLPDFEVYITREGISSPTEEEGVTLCPVWCAKPCRSRSRLSVSDIPGSRDLILPGQTGLLAPARDAKALSEAIRWMLTHPEEWRAMGRQGRERIARDFSPAAYTGLFARLFRSLASS